MIKMTQKISEMKNKFSEMSPKICKRTITGSALVIVVIIIFGTFFIHGRLTGKKTADEIKTYKVSRGNIEVTITGSGSIQPNDQYDITPLVRGEILSSNFEEGDIVEKGDVMYVIDSSDQESTMKKAQNTLRQSQRSYDESVEGYDKLVAKSPISGIVVAVYAEEGDTINTNSKIVDIINNDKMILSIPFIAQQANDIKIGQTASVSVEGTHYSLDGTVTYVASGSTINTEGVRVSNVEIEVKNPGALEEGDKATAIIGSIACNASGTFENKESVSLLSSGSGDIIYQPFKVGDVVTKGQTIMKIDTDAVDKQVENAEINLENAKISYDNTLDQMENYTITAPISGTVIQKNSKAGDTIDNSTASVTMAVIADMSRMTFDISIDELDIQKLKVGQKAVVTSDAFEDKVFSGTVDYISIIGTTSNGVTTYPVTIALDDAGDLLPGMNVDATITVDSSEDTIMVPVDAVQRNNIVYVKDAKGAALSADEQKPEEGKSERHPNLRAPDGFTAVQVTLGINNDSFIEILSGLSEGDVVYVQTSRTSQSEAQTVFPGGMGGGMPGGMPGGMGGDMPSGGGMPSSGGMMR